LEKLTNEKKLTKMEKKAPDALEMAAKASQERKEKKTPS
jgi:hypothetical protein